MDLLMVESMQYEGSELDNWIRSKVQEILKLKGKTVKRFVGVEMAIIEQGEGGLPQFTHPNVPCLQVDPLYLDLESEASIKFITYQNDDTWGLYLSALEKDELITLYAESPDNIFRTRELFELPTGRIEHVEVKRDSNGEITEVLLRIGVLDILLVAGEIYETLDEAGVEFVKGDESVLVFLDPIKASQIPWRSNA